MRYMIEVATGQESGSVYKDRILPRNGDGVVIKTHMLNWQDYDQAIHMIRNPFDAIESYWHWWRDVYGAKDTDWDGHVQDCLLGYDSWRFHTKVWSEDARIPRLLIRYEDVHEYPREALGAVLAWLGLEGDVDKAVEAATLKKMRTLGDAGPKFFRRGTVGEGRKAFAFRQRNLVYKTCQPYMRWFGYD
jgi:hypothetical protein